MKTKMTTLKRLILLLCCTVLAKVGLAQAPTFNLILTNDAQISPTEYQVDIVLKRTGGGPFQLSGHQYGINVNPAIINGGTLTISWLSGSNELTNPAQVNTSLAFNATSNCINIAAPPAVGAGNGSIIADAPIGTKIGTLRIVNSVSFATAQPNLVWQLANAAGKTRTILSYYNGATNTPLVNNVGNTFTTLNNPTLNNTCATPATADAGPDQSVCADNSEVILTPTFGGSASSGSWSGGNGSFIGNSYHPVAADYLAGTATLVYCTDDPAGACEAACDTVVITFNAAVAYYSDLDNDGYGAGPAIMACTQPANSSLVDGDCDDNNNAINPAAIEVCDLVDNDCDGNIDEGFDLDGDTYTSCGGDCDDNNASINPGAQEICDGLDNDCDGSIDDADPSVIGQGTYYADVDVDGFGAGPAILACIQPAGTSTNDDDCDDNNNAINPNAQEICDGIDNDCDGLTDDADGSVIGQGTYYADVDGDGFGAGPAILACVQPAGSSLNADDCDDNNAAVNPNAQEICDGLDNDCDGLTDDADGSVIGQSTFYADVDGDGYGAGAAILACFQPAGTSTNADDCNDNNAAVNPGAQEICDGLDNDCDGLTDDADGSVTGQGTYYADVDGDGYGAGAAILACIQPAGSSTNDDDCDDNNAAINPGAQEICDGIDNDCDGLTDDADGSVIGQGTYYADVDGDSFGAGPAILACIQPAGTVLNSDDCDDNNAAVNPNAQEICDGIDNDCDGLTDDADGSVIGQSTFYADVDGDGYGAGAAILACFQPAGTSTNADDCNDNNAAVNPGAQEICDGLDNDCDGLTDDADGSVIGQSTFYADVDGDGYGAGAAILACFQPAGTSANADDCNDNNAAINPGAQEICDGIDNDCDGLTDDADGSVIGQGTYYADVDGDGYGAGAAILACLQPAGTSTNADDCNDNNAAINPAAQEICDGIDNDCDGLTDDADGSVIGQSTFYADVDGDGYGAGAAILACFQPAGTSTNADDCNDNNAAVNPAAQEICDGIDNDCDGLTDDADGSVIGQSTFYADVDGDGYGAGAAILACFQPAGTSTNADDCNDNNAAINPGAQEICDGIDNDCDGLTDDADGSVIGQGTYYADVDGDGYGAGAAILACIQPAGTSANADDCDDNNAAINPGAQEICDGIDNDCDGLTDDADGSVIGQGTYYADVDGDGYGAGAAILACIQPAGTSTNADDCNDNNAAINPGAQEICDGLDNDCDGLTDDADGSVIGQSTFYTDADADGYGTGTGVLACFQPAGTSTNDDDCNDNNASINPAAQEVCDGVDNDCDGLTDDADGSVIGQSTFYADVDGDGFGAGAAILACFQPAGTSVNNADCNDNDNTVYPGAVEICDDGIDQDCDGFDTPCGCVNPSSADAGPDQIICENSNVSLNGVIGGGATTFVWTTSGSGMFLPNNTSLSVTYVPSAGDKSNGSVQLYLTTDAALNCDPAVDTVDVTITPLPVTPGPITGPTLLCNPPPSGTGVYSIDPVPGAVSYNWTVPVGVTILSGQGSTSITVAYSSGAVHLGISGDVCVTSDNGGACGSSSPSCLTISVQGTAPVTPGSVSGPTKSCPTDVAVYSVSPVARAAYYVWTLPAGCSFVGPNSGNVIQVSFDGSFVGGTLSVQAANACGISPVRNRFINLNNLPAPGPISGPAAGVCGESGLVYSVAAVPGAQSYVWTLPAGATPVGAVDGNSIVVDFSGSFVSGAVSVRAQNGCGLGGVRSLTVKGAPGVAGLINGPTTVCVGSVHQYDVATVSGASNYIWTVPGTIVNGAGTKIIDVQFGLSPTSGQVITVKTTNACGTSPTRILSGITIQFCPRIGDGSISSLNAYPNPATDLLNVDFSSELSQDYVMSLVDMTGRTIYTESNSASVGENNLKVDVKGLATGIYTLNFRLGDASEQIRVVVE